MLGAGLTGTERAKAMSERPAFQPYWGKPAVRNLRGDDGNVGIIRSPVRAIVLPDHHPGRPSHTNRVATCIHAGFCQDRRLEVADRAITRGGLGALSNLID